MTNELIATEIATIKTIVTRMDTRLFGEDGNGGHVAKTDKRIGDLEHTEAKARGAFWALSSLFGLLGGSFLTHLFRKG